MKRIFIAFLCALCMGATCNKPIVPPPPTGPGSCTDACANYRKLGCPAGNPTKAGASCEAVCENAALSGLVHWNLACRAVAASCAAADACEN